jgi:hypothetical protein
MLPGVALSPAHMNMVESVVASVVIAGDGDSGRLVA